MTPMFFLIVVSCFTAVYLGWGFTRLTGENRQILAAVPREKGGDGIWSGVNLTWYGLLSANALALCAALFLVIAGASGVPVGYGWLLLILLFIVLLPSARWIAVLVEGKRHTFTIGGSVFAGIVLSPVLILGLNVVLVRLTGFSYPLVHTLAALAVAYTLGESLGRLACVSFGCCYGKPLTETTPLVRRLFENHAFVYTGHTRKACYASNLHGVKTVPIQAVTSVIYALSGLTGLALTLYGHPLVALLETLVITQVWRGLSEFFRADDRGGGTLSTYQIMGFSVALALVLAGPFLPAGAALRPDIAQGLRGLWSPMSLLLLQGLWLMTFLFMGRSTVTFARMSFHVDEGRI